MAASRALGILSPTGKAARLQETDQTLTIQTPTASTRGITATEGRGGSVGAEARVSAIGTLAGWNPEKASMAIPEDSPQPLEAPIELDMHGWRFHVPFRC